MNKRPYELANGTVKETYHVHMFEQIAIGNIKAIDLLLQGK